MKQLRLAAASVLSVAVALASASCSKSDTAPSASSSSSSSCSVAVGAVPTTVTAVGVTGTLTVTAASGCSWTVSPSASFITVSPSSGSGNGSVTYTVASNQGPVRSASITIGSTTINFTQDPPKAPANCAVGVSSTTNNVAATGGTVTATVSSSNSACAWTATTTDSFLTIASGASGSGAGTVTITVPANTGGARTGTVTIGGVPLTITQAGSGLIASFQMTDPGQTIGPVTECRIRGTGSSTCTLSSTSFSSRSIISYEWTIQYTYVTVKTINTVSTFPSTTITDTCGQTGATDDGTIQPLSVSLKITDGAGNTATATAGSGDQPALSIRLYTCGV